METFDLKNLTVDHNVSVENFPFNLFKVKSKYVKYVLPIGKIAYLTSHCVVTKRSTLARSSPTKRISSKISSNIVDCLSVDK